MRNACLKLQGSGREWVPPDEVDDIMAIFLHRCIWSSINGIMKEWSKKSFENNYMRLYMSIIEATIFPKYINPQIQSVFVWDVVFSMFFSTPMTYLVLCFLSLRSLSTAKKSWAPPDRVSGLKKRGIDGTSDLKLMAGWREDFINASCLCILLWFIG